MWKRYTTLTSRVTRKLCNNVFLYIYSHVGAGVYWFTRKNEVGVLIPSDAPRRFDLMRGLTSCRNTVYYPMKRVPS